MRFSFRGRSKVLREIATADANFSLAVQTLRAAIQRCDESVSGDSTLEAARIDGWCEAAHVLAGTPLLDEYEHVRAAVIPS
jgi:hypothetical protein